MYFIKKKRKLSLYPKGVTGNNIVSVFLYSVDANDEKCPSTWYACSHFGLALANPHDKKIFIKKGIFLKEANNK